MKSLKDIIDLDKLEIIESTRENVMLNCVLHPNSLIYFPVETKYEINNIALFKISKEDERYIDIPIKTSDIDVIGNIHVINVNKTKLLLNESILDEYPERFIKCCMPYVEIKVRIYFKKDNIPEQFIIRFDAYTIGDGEMRRKLMYSSFTDGVITYMDGMIKLNYY